MSTVKSPEDIRGIFHFVQLFETEHYVAKLKTINQTLIKRK